MADAPRILVVDDDPEMVDLLRDLLTDQGLRVDDAADGRVAEERLADRQYDLAIVDMVLPEVNGLDVLSHGKSVQPECTFILITADTQVEKAVAAMKYGADDFFQKPFHVDDFLNVVNGALKRRKSLDTEYEWPDYFGFVGQSDAMQHVYSAIDRVAESDSTVLVTGENGTGKELVVRAIHGKSKRRNEPLVVIHCGAIPEGVLESELFGHERGAFTSAVTLKHGIFKIADGGTVFLDEIGEMEFSLQVKLLRVLEAGTFRPVGATKDIQVDVRVLAATNTDLEKAVEAKRFREDLYYRLNVLAIELPPLRNRDGDIELLVQHFVNKYSGGNGTPKTVSREAMNALRMHTWPGNVRELENTIERATLMSPGNRVSLNDLPQQVRGGSRVGSSNSNNTMLDGTFKEAKLIFEGQYVRRQLERARGNVALAARRAQMSRAYFYELLKKHEADID